MSAPAVRAALQATPFRPLAVRMADGRSFEIRHQDYLLVVPTGRTVFAFIPSGDEFSILAMLLMTAIEFNGQGARLNTDAAPGQV